MWVTRRGHESVFVTVCGCTKQLDHAYCLLVYVATFYFVRAKESVMVGDGGKTANETKASPALRKRNTTIIK